jgi:predicted PurR-regulated permease PerM
MENHSKINTSTFLIIFIFIIFLNAYLFLPLLNAFIFAGILAGTFYPFLKWSGQKFNLKKEWAALLTTLLIVCTIILPLIYVIFQISKEAVFLYGMIREGLSAEQVHNFLFGEGYGATMMKKALDLFGSDLTNEEVYAIILKKAQSYSGLILSQINSWLGDTLNFLFQFLIMILAIYSFFLRGDKMKEYIFELSPLPDDQEQLVLDRFNQMNYVTMVGNGIGGVIQGVLAGIGFWFAGISSVFLWSSIMVILAFIPLVGISIVFIPACLYLFLTGHVTTSIVLLVYCGIVSLVVENWFKPKFIGDKLSADGLMMLFYIVAGMGVFGMLGIFYGPLLFIIFLTLSDIFTKHYMPQLSKGNHGN